MQHLIITLLMLAGWLSSNHFPPWVSWHSELPFFVIAVAASIWSVARQGLRGDTPMPAACAIPLALAAVLALQAVLGLIDWWGQVLVVALYLLTAVTAIAWGWQGASYGRHPASGTSGEWMAWALIAGAVLLAGTALVQVLRVGDSLSFIAPAAYLRRPGGNLAQPNHLATLLVMGIASGCYLHAAGRLGIATLLVLVSYLLLGLGVTESRGGLLSLLMLGLFLAWKRPFASPGSSVWVAGITSAFGVGLFLAWPTFYRFVFRGLDQGGAALERLASSGADPRLTLWQQMLDASLQRPWFGWGFRDTAEAHNAVSHEVVGALSITYSHNILIDLLVWIGWPLTLLLGAAAAWWVWTRLRAACDTSAGWFGMALLIPFAIHSSLEFPFAYTYLLFPAMFGVGLVEAAARKGSPVLRLPAWLTVPVVLLLASAGAWSVVDYLRVEEDFRVARFQLMRIGSPHLEPPPQIQMLDQLEQMVAATRVPMSTSMSADQLELLRRAAVHNPWSGAQYRYALALALNGRIQEARRQMLVIRAQHGVKIFEQLNVQLEQDLAKRQLPGLDMHVTTP